MLEKWRAARAQRRAAELNRLADATNDRDRRATLRDLALIAENRALYLTGQLTVGTYRRTQDMLREAIAWRTDARLRAEGRGRPLTWDDATVARLKAMWAEGKSAGLIADELGGGVTRNAVLGKINRLGLLKSRPTLEQKVHPGGHGQPPIYGARMHEHISVQMPAALLAAVRAKANGVTLSVYVRALIAADLNRADTDTVREAA